MSPLLVPRATDRIILGLMTFGPDESKGARITDVGELTKALNLFQSRGYNELDTARVYIGSKQEAFTRETQWKNKGFTLATKIEYPGKPGTNTAKNVIESLNTSLKELGTDCVDLLYLHAPDRGVPFADTLETIDKLHKEGKFVRFGLSNFTAFEVAEIVTTCKYNGWVRPTVFQAMYNAITRSIEAELIPACRRYGMDVVVYNPIAGGLFSGKIKSADMAPTSGRFSDAGGQGRRYRDRYFSESTFKSLQLIETAVAKHDLSMIEAALRWAVHHSALKVKDGNDGIIIGVSSVQQLDENLTSLEKGPLPEEVVKAMDQAWVISKAETPKYWHNDLKYTYDTHEALFGAGSQ